MNFRFRPPDLTYGWWQSGNDFQFIMAIYLTLDLWFIIRSFCVYFYCLALTQSSKFSVEVIVWLSDLKTFWPKTWSEVVQRSRIRLYNQNFKKYTLESPIFRIRKITNHTIFKEIKILEAVFPGPMISPHPFIFMVNYVKNKEMLTVLIYSRFESLRSTIEKNLKLNEIKNKL